jgi:hypothetical protein
MLFSGRSFQRVPSIKRIVFGEGIVEDVTRPTSCAFPFGHGLLSSNVSSGQLLLAKASLDRFLLSNLTC